MLSAHVAGEFGFIVSVAGQPRVLPELKCDREWINTDPFPPYWLVALAVKFAMMHSAQWNGELVAHLAA